MFSGSEHFHNLALAYHCGDGEHSATKSLPQTHHVGFGIFMLPRESLSSPAESSLNFVEHEQRVVTRENFSQPGKKTVRRHENSRFGLNWFNQHRRRVRRNRPFYRVKIAKWNYLEAR